MNGSPLHPISVGVSLDCWILFTYIECILSLVFCLISFCVAWSFVELLINSHFVFHFFSFSLFPKGPTGLSFLRESWHCWPEGELTEWLLLRTWAHQCLEEKEEKPSVSDREKWELMTQEEGTHSLPDCQFPRLFWLDPVGHSFLLEICPSLGFQTAPSPYLVSCSFFIFAAPLSFPWFLVDGLS